MAQHLASTSMDSEPRNLFEQARTDDASLASFAGRMLGHPYEVRA